MQQQGSTYADIFSQYYHATNRKNDRTNKAQAEARKNNTRPAN